MILLVIAQQARITSNASNRRPEQPCDGRSESCA